MHTMQYRMHSGNIETRGGTIISYFCPPEVGYPDVRESANATPPNFTTTCDTSVLFVYISLITASYHPLSAENKGHFHCLVWSGKKISIWMVNVVVPQLDFELLCPNQIQYIHGSDSICQLHVHPCIHQQLAVLYSWIKPQNAAPKIAEKLMSEA